MKPSVMPYIVVILLIIGALSTSAFVVSETEQVVVVQFGEVMRLVDKPGLNFKIPFIQEAMRFEKRWLEWDGDASQITTRDKRYIYIDVFARWRIKDPLVFIETLRDEDSAQGRLDDIIDNATRNVVANHRLIEAIRSTNRSLLNSRESALFGVNNIDDTLGDPNENEVASAGDNSAPDEAAASEKSETLQSEQNPEAEENPAEAADEEKDAPKKPEEPAQETAATKRAQEKSDRNSNTYAIEVGRDQLTRLVLEKASAKAEQLGIELRDVQIKRISYIESVQAEAFDRMISERKRVAEAYRSDGRGRSAEIIGKMEMELQQIQSEAYRESQKIMGRADAKAAEIYAKAYNTNPEFYTFTKTMESYLETIDENSWLVLSTDADYLRHLQTAKGKNPE